MASGDTYEVDEIVGRRTTKEGNEDYLVRWKNYPPLLTTWEPLHNFANCQEAVQEYFTKHWPIPGSQTTVVEHLAEKPNFSKKKKELVTLQALPLKKQKKLLRGVRQDLKDEILRRQVEEKSLTKSVCNGLNLPLVLDQDTMVKFNDTLPESYNRSLRSRTVQNDNRVVKNPVKRKLSRPLKPGKVSKLAKHSKVGRPPKQKSLNVNSDLDIPDEQFVLSIKQEYDQSHEILQTKAKSLKGKKMKKRRNGMILSAQKNRVVIDSPSLTLPSRLTRQTLPGCSTQCILEDELVVTNRDGCLYIKICNKAKKNVINRQICEDIIAALRDAGKDDVSLVVISGSGSVFSYGWDLDQFQSISHTERREILQKYRLLTRMLITCPKPLIAAVNGSAAGFGVSLVALCDFVFAADQATFQTKFAEWGHPPVGCCSYTLQDLLGTSQAMSVILFNTEISASNAKHYGLVSEILKTDQFEKELKSNIQRLLSVPLQCLRDTKTLVYGGKVQDLENTNHEECDFFQKYVVNDFTLKNILSRWRVSIRE
ncbi:chromodomain Y-like protein [Dendronephthya gigantea]|uniref:chromodomain Y-like protein n=1 Tax=Dendronephthya gigantea TaxID=151771 RepID=UPI00106966C7|nr:chromodomain Y-like protein [Dendronephthya gigantea]